MKKHLSLAVVTIVVIMSGSARFSVESRLTAAQATVIRLTHFKCYQTDDSPVGATVRLQDQFDIPSFESAFVQQPVAFCNPVVKIHPGQSPTQSPFNPLAHLKVYAIQTNEPPATRTVIVNNQFGSRQKLTVSQPAVALAVPTRKLPLPAPRGLDHFKCYQAKGEPINAVVTLRDQFHLEKDVTVLEPFAFCNPTRKIHNGVATGVQNAQAHLTCYTITPKPFSTTVRVTNQFRDETLRVRDANLLCAPSLKIDFSKAPDQVNDPPTDTSFGCGETGLSLYQSFTPTASRLVAVDLRFRVGGSFPAAGVNTTINIRVGSPAGAVLASATAFIPGPQAVGTQLLIQLHLPAPIALTPGATYVIEWLSPAPAGTPAGTILTWMGREDNPYPGGNAFGCNQAPVPTDDLNFITYH